MITEKLQEEQVVLSVRYSCERQYSEYYPYYECEIHIEECLCEGVCITDLIRYDYSASRQLHERLAELNRFGKRLFAEIEININVSVIEEKVYYRNKYLYTISYYKRNEKKHNSKKMKRIFEHIHTGAIIIVPQEKLIPFYYISEEGYRYGNDNEGTHHGWCVRIGDEYVHLIDAEGSYYDEITNEFEPYEQWENLGGGIFKTRRNGNIVFVGVMDGTILPASPRFLGVAI